MLWRGVIFEHSPFLNFDQVSHLRLEEHGYLTLLGLERFGIQDQDLQSVPQESAEELNAELDLQEQAIVRRFLTHARQDTDLDCVFGDVTECGAESVGRWCG